MTALAKNLDDGLEEVFGFTTFRPGQRDVAESILEGLSVLAVMPTGSGKSLCYQLPACIVDGVTLVISPLIALMKDQVDALYGHGVSATCINSSLEWKEQKLRLRGISEGIYDIVYVAPERFRNQAFRDAISGVDVAVLAVDEAHCISQWGHDFRPDYLELGRIREELGEPVTVALTATATPEVQTDILARLGIEDARVVVSGFERPNLFFEVHRARGDDDKISRMRGLIDEHRGESTVVYCATRKQVDEVRARLEHAGHLVGTYHGGMSDRKRTRVQDAFMAGDLPVLAATNAFGMGVDKPDVRAIVHYNVPGSLEAYYQEAGRAGRDGEPAHCLLLYQTSDRSVHEFFIETAFPPPEVVMRVWSELRRYGTGTHQVGPEQLADHINRSGKRDDPDVHRMAVDASLRLLKQAAHIDRGWRDGFPWIEVRDHARTRDLRIDWDRVVLRRQIAQRQLDDVCRYAMGDGCRQAHLLRHFDSEPSFGHSCDNCDICVGAPEYRPGSSRGRIEMTDDPVTAIRKLLSGIARVRGRVDRSLVMAMLRGSQAKHVVAEGLGDLSTYGILDDLGPAAILELIDACIRYGLVVKDSRNRLNLSEEGVEVMRGEQELPAPLEKRLESRICMV